MTSVILKAAQTALTCALLAATGLLAFGALAQDPRTKAGLKRGLQNTGRKS